TNESNFVLHWEINNAKAVHAAGRAESDVFNEGGIKWTAAYEKRKDNTDKADFSLRCDVDSNGPWKVEAEVVRSLIKSDGSEQKSKTRRVSFHADINFVKVSMGWWYDLYYEQFNFITNDTLTVEFHVHIISLQTNVVPGIFAAPNNRSDVILKIGGEKLHVSKEYLAVHSPVFSAMFFGDFAEKGKKEVEIKDVVYEEFVDLLKVLYCQTNGITDSTVANILKLADRFQ
ncbi:hypothetical protein PMAYCL1PPCAC_14727, partial [Pristionchus mayeri]